jgi:hypothetical protein
MAIKIGINAARFANKAALDFYVGTKVANLLKALREVHDAKLTVDQLANSDLVNIGYDGGGDGNGAEVAYLKGGLARANDLYLISKGQAPGQAPTYNYDGDLRYIAGSES